MNRYGEVQCMDMDWNNSKEISAKEIAYCIVNYNLTREVPEARRETVLKEIHTYKAVKVKEDIEAMLYNKEYDSYHYDPELFHTIFEVETAFAEERSIIDREMEKVDKNYKYKNTGTHSRDYKAMINNFRKTREQYIKMGGSPSSIDALLNELPEPTKGTLKQDIDANRKHIKQTSINLGTSPTRSNEIAIAITTNAYLSLQ